MSAPPEAAPTLTERAARWLLLLAAVGIPASLVWDFSWESTVGIDLVWAPAHVATYISIALAGGAALTLVRTARQANAGVQLGRFAAPLGAWIALWGAFAFLAAVLFDRWWQAGYGLAAGIWHPPQIAKAVAFFAVLVGAWLVWSSRQTAKLRGGPMAFAMAGGVVLAMITVVSLVSIYPNRQHSAAFYQLACATYPLVLVAVASAGRFRLSATAAALCYTALLGVLVWLLPLIPGQPQVAPIYNPRDHLMPPPFPLILIVPALALDALLRVFPSRGSHPWRQAGECGLAFFLVFTAVQWNFARFLLSPAADHWFFAGGGRQWPFFLKIDEHARVTFWQTGAGEMNLANGLIAAGSAILAARAGLALGGWLQRVQR